MKKYKYVFDIVVGDEALPRCKRVFTNRKNCIRRAIATCKAENANRFILRNTTLGLAFEISADFKKILSVYGN